MFSRAMIRLPMAAWMITSKRCRSISPRSFFTRLRPRLSELLDLTGVRNLLRIVDQDRLALARQQLVGHVRRCLHEIQLAVALQTLLNDLAMQQSKKPTAESEPQALAHLRLIHEARII